MGAFRAQEEDEPLGDDDWPEHLGDLGVSILFLFRSRCRSRIHDNLVADVTRATREHQSASIAATTP
jgi:hypothetical protein